MATTSRKAAEKLGEASNELTTIYYDLQAALKDGDTSRYRLNGSSIPGIMGQIDAAQKAILSIKNLMLKVDIKTK